MDYKYKLVYHEWRNLGRDYHIVPIGFTPGPELPVDWFVDAGERFVDWQSACARLSQLKPREPSEDELNRTGAYA